MTTPNWIAPALSPKKKKKTAIEKKIAKVFKSHVLKNVPLKDGEKDVEVEMLDIHTEPNDTLNEVELKEMFDNIRPNLQKLLSRAVKEEDYINVVSCGQMLLAMSKKM